MTQAKQAKSNPNWSRRDFLRGGALAATTALTARLPLAAQKQSRDEQPNILYLFSDQHRACSLPGEPFSNQIAPNMTRMMADGIRMDACYSNYPVCSPYRAILFTGKWPIQTDTQGNIGPSPPIADEEYTIGEVFRDAGYHTGYTGKWHLGGGTNGAVFGYDYFHTWFNTNDHWNSTRWDGTQKVPQNIYNAEGMTNDVLEFIDLDHGGKPWFLICAWNPPHSDFYDAPQWAKDLYDPATIPVRPNVPPDQADAARTLMAGYQAHITAIDRELGRILDRLDQPDLQNTVLIYTTDHGEMGRSQEYGGKRLPWDESCHIPFFARWPGRIAPGSRSSAILQTVDMQPTVCGLVGIEAPTHCVGRDMSPALLGQPFEPSDSAFLMHMKGKNASQEAYEFRGLRTDRYTFALLKDGPWLLYDDQEDPFQLHNRIHDPAYRDVAREMHERLRAYLKETGDPFKITSSAPYVMLR